MKIISLLIILSLTGCAYNAYTRQDIIDLGFMWAACYKDYDQTREILNNDKYEEMNGLIQNDSDAKIFLLGMPLILTIGGLFVPPKDRKYVFRTVAGVKAVAVLYNYNLGVR